MKADDNMVKLAAQQSFYELKQACLELERRGYRPNVIAHANGMPDCFSVDPAHPTTPAIEMIRAAKCGVPLTHVA